MKTRLVDLSLTFHEGMHGYSREQVRSFAERGYTTSNLTFYSHAGTHMDARLHFIEGAASIEAWPLEQCIGSALVIDLSHKQPDSLITVDDIAAHNELIQAGSRVLLRTDWDLRLDTPDYRDHFPRISHELAHWLVSREVALLGVETPSVASLSNLQELQEVHRILLGGDIIIVESLACLRDLTEQQVWFIAFPLSIIGADGCPVRAAAYDGASPTT